MIALACLLLSVAGAADPERGAALAGLGGCLACHTADGGEAGAGGHVIHTRYGDFVGSNLTPDPEHGLGAWSYADFERAMRLGRAPDGRRYYAAFPYAWFTAITDDDLADLWAWLGTLPPVARPDEAHDLRFPAKGTAWAWQILAFRPGAFTPDPMRSEAWSRGAYLGTALGHCGACHTPLSALGVPKRGRALSGSDAPPVPSPNISPHDHGIGAWSARDISSFLDDGMTPEGDVVGGEMYRIVEEGTRRLSPEDRAAIATWLLEQRPRPSRPPPAEAPVAPREQWSEEW